MIFLVLIIFLRTPLYFAAQYGRTELVDRIIKTAAANVDEPDNAGWTPLFIAALNGFDGNSSNLSLFPYFFFECCLSLRTFLHKSESSFLTFININRRGGAPSGT